VQPGDFISTILLRCLRGSEDTTDEECFFGHKKRYPQGDINREKSNAFVVYYSM
jgi:hypothetical protein